MLEKELVIIGLYLKFLLVYPYFQGVLTFLEWIDADICWHMLWSSNSVFDYVTNNSSYSLSTTPSLPL